VESTQVYTEHPLLSTPKPFFCSATAHILFITFYISMLPSQCSNQARTRRNSCCAPSLSSSLTADDALFDGTECGDTVLTALTNLCTCLSLITLHCADILVKIIALYVYR
jgi:hypothetical protein